MKCCECKMEPYKCFNVENHSKKGIALAVLAGITALVMSILGTAGVVPLHPHLQLGLAMMGGTFVFICTFFAGADLGTTDSKAVKVAIVIVQLIAMGAIVCGALGMSGHLSFLRGVAGPAVAAAGGIVLLANIGPYFCAYPYKLNG